MRLHVRAHNIDIDPEERQEITSTFISALDQFEEQVADVMIRVERPNAEHIFVCRASVPLDRQRPVLVEEEDRRLMTAVDVAADRLAYAVEQRLTQRLHAERANGREKVRGAKERLVRP